MADLVDLAVADPFRRVEHLCGRDVVRGAGLVGGAPFRRPPWRRAGCPLRRRLRLRGADRGEGAPATAPAAPINPAEIPTVRRRPVRNPLLIDVLGHRLSPQAMNEKRITQPASTGCSTVLGSSSSRKLPAGLSR